MITGQPTFAHARHVAPVLKVAPEEIALALFAFLTHFRSQVLFFKGNLCSYLGWLDWIEVIPSENNFLLLWWLVHW